MPFGIYDTYNEISCTDEQHRRHSSISYSSTGGGDAIRTMYQRRLLTQALPRIYVANQEQETTYGGTCKFCGNMSGRKDRCGNCISCGGPC